MNLDGINLNFDGSSITNDITKLVAAGEHMLKESEIPGYDVSMDGNCASDGSITVSLNQTAVCRITFNDIDPARFFLIILILFITATVLITAKFVGKPKPHPKKEFSEISIDVEGGLEK